MERVKIKQLERYLIRNMLWRILTQNMAFNISYALTKNRVESQNCLMHGMLQHEKV